ncbi:hypothetical protein BJ508DRAFT_333558 [Ascobolus immersus RN42]|uniref:Uncharacterized protein n=1 Tax=Ascobolus immersus RN42 TaxID=1160509 RepID=A0A3N4HJE3_ASCIM|nr:hypothetical protein BJ508DRAFT_333558 [Ascobolus immersus RN42]
MAETSEGMFPPPHRSRLSAIAYRKLTSKIELSAPNVPGFLRLPLELRLDVYYLIKDLVSLLSLTHTCRTTYTDINNRKSLLTSVYHHYTMYHTDYRRSSDSHPLLPRDAVPLTIPLLANSKLSNISISDRFRGPIDVQKKSRENIGRNFNRIFGQNDEERRLDKKGWWCCLCCVKIRRTTSFPFYRSNMVERGRDLNYCLYCSAAHF